MIKSATARSPAFNGTLAPENAPVDRVGLVALLIGIALVTAVLIALTSGPVSMNLSQLLQALTARESAPPSHVLVIWELRLPRILLGILVGAVLAVSGAALQGLFRNPLADAGLLGVSSGAALGAVAYIVLAASVPPTLSPLLGRYGLPLAGFTGGLLVTGLAWRLSRMGGTTSVAHLLLAGIAINALAGAGTGLLTYMANDAELRSLSFWTMGSLAFATWADLLIIAPWTVAGIAVLIPLTGPLNAFLLGENVVGHLGYSVERIKIALIITTALLVGAAVSMTGPVGFVGLLIPHLVRGITGANHRHVLPLSALAGAFLMVSADIVCRWAVTPAELPIGLAMALLGSPFFLYLLRRQANDGA